jgi:hypothetical protein
MVIDGFPGVGKTTLVEHILMAARARAKMLKLLTNRGHQLNVYLTATTNKAANVLGAMTKEDGMSIHSLLGLRPVPDHRTGKMNLKQSPNPRAIDDALIIIDEASMENMELLEVVRGRTQRCKVIHVMDSYQLAPIGESHCPVSTEVKKQAKLKIPQRYGGEIAKLGTQFRHAIDTGEFTPIIPNGAEIIKADGPTFQSMVDTAFNGKQGVDHARIICWTNDKVRQYNDYTRNLVTQSEFFEPGEMVITNKPIMSKKQTAYSTDSIVQVSDVDSYVGEEYGVKGIWYTLSGNTEVFQALNQYDVKQRLDATVKSKDWATHYMLKDFFGDLRPVNSCTSHKSQGSTYDIAFVDLDDIGGCRKPIDVARMLNVASTRASQQVVYYGNLPAKYGG